MSYDFFNQMARRNEFLLFIIAFCNWLAQLRALRLVIDTPDSKIEVHLFDAFYSNMAHLVDFVAAARISLQSPGA